MNWSKRIVHWEDDQAHYFSVVFSWDLWQFCQTAQPELDGRTTVIGGPAVILNPEWVPQWVAVGNSPGALQRHNPTATRTSIGCIRKCRFCSVSKIEPEFRELPDWTPGPIVIDNNFLACSRRHFDNAIDRLKKLPRVDFQGIDARIMTRHHADRLAECNAVLHIGFDDISLEPAFLKAHQMLRDAGIPKRSIRAYVLIGYNDTPEEAEYKLELVRSLGSYPNPMRYQPSNSKLRNEYVHPAWTNKDLLRFMKYWARLRFYGGIPFKNFQRVEKRWE